MEHILISPGSMYLYNDKVVVIKSVESNLGQVWCDVDECIEPKLIFINQLRPLPKKKSESVPIPSGRSKELSQIDSLQWDKATKKKQMILDLERNANINLTPKCDKRTVGEIAKLYGYNRSTAYLLSKNYRESGREVRSLIDKVKGGLGRKRISSEVEKIVQEVIKKIYLTPQRNTIINVYTEVRRICYQNDIKYVPGYNTIRRRINELADAIIVSSREGQKKYRELFHPISGSVADENNIPYPLSTVEIDHTPVDIILIDEFYGEPLGRPYLTIAIDVYSRIILGFHLSFDPVSTDSVAQCIAHAVCPKEDWLKQLQIEADWPCWGVPELFRVDKAMEFRSEAYKKACNNYGINIKYRKYIEEGGVIERLIGVSMKHVHTLPGTTFSNVQEKGEYDSEKFATMTLKGFEEWFIWWVIMYNNKKHASLGMSPLSKYLQAFKPSVGKPLRNIPIYYTDSFRIRLDFSPYVERTIQRNGVIVDHIQYVDSTLKWYREEDMKRKYIFRRLPGDISIIWMYHPVKKDYIPIKYANVNHPSISIWELRLVKKRLKDRQIPIDELAIFKAVEAMRDTVLKEINNRKNIRLSVATNRIIKQLNIASINEKKEVVKINKDNSFEDNQKAIDKRKDVKPFDFLL